VPISPVDLIACLIDKILPPSRNIGHPPTSTNDVVVTLRSSLRGVQGREFRTARCTPLTTTAITTLKEWLREPGRRGAQALFPNIHGGRLSVDAVQYLIGKYVAIAGERMPSLKQKRVSPHSLRHSAAMELLQAGVECSVIALWLGHESVDTTQVYLHAHLALKEAALARLTPYNGETGNRFQPDDKLLAFLDAL
jgi:integrase/recombinase XerD